tara:strand:- start:1506 stop:1721 length:216 start_codon:yes stop_codon:yes gene_type:complete
MNEKNRASLDDSQMLFTLLTALVKKSDGKIIITEEEMDSVTKTDMVMMYYNRDSKEIILCNHFLEGPDGDN